MGFHPAKTHLVGVRAVKLGDDGGATRARAAVSLSRGREHRPFPRSRGARLCNCGRVAQWESACFTRKRSEVQNLPRPPHNRRPEAISSLPLPPEEGHYRRTCQCWSEEIYEPRVDTRTRLDPYDPSDFSHFPACEHRDTTDPVIVKAILTVQERETYWYVHCRTCETGWQTSYYGAVGVG